MSNNKIVIRYQTSDLLEYCPNCNASGDIHLTGSGCV